MRSGGASRSIEAAGTRWDKAQIEQLHLSTPGWSSASASLNVKETFQHGEKTESLCDYRNFRKR
jgi:hypothetical protein